MRKVRVGTRGSRLALEQTRIVLDLLSGRGDDLDFQVLKVRTAGDRFSLAGKRDSQGKGAFTGEIENLLLRGDIDIAVHSLKDLSVDLDGRLAIGATPPRGDHRDALVSANGKMLADLPKGASIGTSSIRRKAQLIGLRRDLRVSDLRGNVETRVKSVAKGLDGVVLAAAGLDRLSMGQMATQRFTVDEIVPAAGQGTIAVEIRKNDAEVERFVSQINDEKTASASACERAFAKTIGGDCYVPAGAHAAPNGRSLTLTGMMASPDGARVLKRSMISTDPVWLGEKLGEELLALGGKEIMNTSGATGRP